MFKHAQTAKFHFGMKNAVPAGTGTKGLGDRDVVAAQGGKVAVEGERLEWRRHVDRLE